MHTPNILVVEDHDVTSYALVKLLNKHGYKVDLADDGEKAMQKMATSHSDLIVTDLGLPNVTGHQLISTIRSSVYSKTRILVLTSIATENTMTETFEMGADDYVCKPFTPADLMGRIQKLLNN